MSVNKRNISGLWEGSAAIGSGLVVIMLSRTTLDQGAGAGGSMASPAFYPQFISGIMIFLGILLVIGSLKRVEQATVTDSPPSGSLKKMLAAAVGVVLYTVLLEYLGFILVTPFFMAFLFWLLKVRGWFNIALLSLGSSAAIYFFFVKAMDIVLPEGVFGFFI